MKKDTFSQGTYEKSNLKGDLTNILISKLYDIVLELLYEKINININRFNILDLYNSNKIINYYQNQILQFDQYSNYKNNIDLLKYNKLIKVVNFEDLNENNLNGIIGNVHKLPVYNKPINENNLMTIPYVNKEIKDDIMFENSICQHNIDWINISKLKSDNINLYNENIYNFIKKYVILNKDNNYICKSCKQLINLQNVLSNPYDGGSSGIDIILSSRKIKTLVNNKEYKKFHDLIAEMNQLVLKIAQICNLYYYIGSGPIYDMRREDIIKKVIDIILIHHKTLKVRNMNKREREIKAFQKYNILYDFSNFFIFTISNDIFKYSSIEIDKFKKIKRNNIITYIIYFMIMELNATQINMFDFDKRCNFLFFNKFGYKLFDKIKLLINNKNDIIEVSKLKTLCYIIYYFSCKISKYDIWYNLNEDKKMNEVYIQKSIIHTFFDLVNSLIEVLNNKKKVSFIYEVLMAKLNNKITQIFRNKIILDEIQIKENKFISYNKEKNKIQILKSKIKSINIKNKKPIVDKLSNYLIKNNIFYYIIKKKEDRKLGLILKNNEIKELNTEFLNSNLLKLGKIYNKNGIIRSYKLSDDQINKINKKELIETKENINLNKKKINKIYTESKKTNIKEKLKFEDNIIDKFLNLVKKYTDSNIKVSNTEFNLFNDQIILTHDYLGNRLDKKLKINMNSDKIKVIYDNEIKLKVFELYDKLNNIKIIYNYHTFHYLGYKYNKKKIIYLDNLNIYCIFIPSIKRIITTLGFKKYYYTFNNKYEYKNLILNAINNIKNYINNYKLFINQIINKNKFYSNKIVKYYSNKIKNLKLFSKNKKAFNSNLNKKFDINIDDNMTNISNIDLSKKSKLYENLVNYFISEIYFILDLNKDKYLNINLIYFTISILNYFYKYNFEQTTNFQIIRYYHILDSELIDEIKENSLYSKDEIDKLTEEEIDTINQNKIDIDEKQSAIDTDDIDNEDGDQDVMFYNEN